MEKKQTTAKKSTPKKVATKKPAPKKVGRPLNVESPAELYDLFIQYRREVKSNPRLKKVFVGKDGRGDFEELERPLTLEGFEVFCYDKVGCIEQYFKNQGGLYDKFIPICSHIKREIRTDQIEGGMAGQYNASITQRLNGLTEKQQIEQKIVDRFDFDE